MDSYLLALLAYRMVGAAVRVSAEGRCLVLGNGEATRGLVALDLLGFFYSDIGAPPPAARA